MRSLARPDIVFACLVMGSLAACVGPRFRTVGPPVQAPQITPEAFIMPDAAALPYRVWRPAGRVRAIILALHGFNDYSRAFADPASWWARRGIMTYAYDQRGFGETEMAGFWPGRAALTADLAHVLALLARRHPGIPKIVLGESMGAAVVMAALAENGRLLRRPDGVVLVSPAVWGWETMNVFYQATLWLTAHTLPGLRFTGESLGIRPSDNIAMLRALAADPLVIKKTRTDAIYGLVNLMDAAAKGAPGVMIPTLLAYGAKDEVIPKSALRTVIGRLPRPLVIGYDNGFHMLLRDCQAPLVWRDIAWWITTGRHPQAHAVDWPILPEKAGDAPENPQCDGDRIGNEGQGVEKDLDGHGDE